VATRFQRVQERSTRLPQSLDVAITLVQRDQQFQDHALECGYIIGQVFSVGWRDRPRRKKTPLNFLQAG
jgi:hypothetical protein